METILLNLFKSLIVSEAQSLAKEHVEEAINDNLDEEQRELLDSVVDMMPDNSFKSLKEFLG
jgi:hypothetical protein